MGKPLNILLVMADQLSALALRQYGSTIAKTPNIDRLADQGIVLPAAYCNNPICAPSRVAMWTGRLATRINVFDNGHEFAANHPTLAHYLRNLGYRTVAIGKMHFIGPDQLHGFEERLNHEIYPSNFNWIADWTAARQGKGALKGHQTLDERVRKGGLVKRTLQIDYDEDTAFHGVQKIYDLARDDDVRPFFLTVSFSHPHDPYEAIDPYWSQYTNSEVTPPGIGPLAWEEHDAHSQRLLRMVEGDTDVLTDVEIRRARRAYFANVSYIDAKLGQLLDALDDTGLDDNTAVVFVSDHGDMIGERGMWFKFNFREWSLRVPFIMRVPGTVKGVMASGQASLLDMLPTLVELATDGAGVDLVAPVEGSSVLGVAGPEAHTGKDVTYAEYTSEGSLAPQMMIRRGMHKLIVSPGDPALLYDLENDPDEMFNIAALDSAATAMTALKQELHRVWDVETLNARCLASQQLHHFLKGTLRQGAPFSWDYVPRNDASQRYVRDTPGTDKKRKRLPRP